MKLGGIFMLYSQQRGLKWYDHIIGCFCQVNTSWSLSKPFPFSVCVNTTFIMVSAPCVCTHSPGWPQHEAFTGWAERWDLGEQHKLMRGEEDEEANMTSQVCGCDSMPAAFCRLWAPRRADNGGAWGKPAQKTELQEVPRDSARRCDKPCRSPLCTAMSWGWFALIPPDW